MKFSRSVLVKVAGTAVALAALGTASVAQARSDVAFSINAAVAPGVNVGVSNGPVYYQPSVGYYPRQGYVQQAPVYYQQQYPQQVVYEQPAPVYYESAPVYYQPAPVYYRQAPVYYRSAPVLSIGFGGWYGGHGGGHRHGGYYR